MTIHYRGRVGSFLVIALSIMMLFAFTACDEKDEDTAPAGTPIATSAEFSSAITNGGTYYLSDDLTAESETAFQIAKDLTLNLDKGKIYGLLGENGSGKTTWRSSA